MRVLVTGVKGQLGYDVMNELKKQGLTGIGVDVDEMDITDAEACRRVITEAKPDAVIHCAAYTAVDAAEQNMELCRKVNADGTRNIAEVCKGLDIKMMYISTDYVFNGQGTRPWEPDDHREPLVTALKLMGVDEVYDTTFGADFTTIAESEEFLERLKNGGPFPMFTSCCPAWVKYLENENPKYLKNISTCKSPMEMVGAIFRDKYAAKDAVDGRTTYHIAIMPCTAKKMEAARPEFIHDGRPDVDLVLTTHEVIDMMQETGIQLGELELESPDLPFGLGSGAAVIYGTSGGVAEAVVRHCLPDKSKNALREISILGLRGDAPIKEASVTIGDTELKLAVVNGLANAKKLLKEIDEGKKFYHLIEVMTCQGGCVGGAGQPYGLKKSKEKRGDGLHLSDNAAMFKRAERNPVVAQMMAEYGEERCHELLHVSYTNK